MAVFYLAVEKLGYLIFGIMKKPPHEVNAAACKSKNLFGIIVALLKFELSVFDVDDFQCGIIPCLVLSFDRRSHSLPCEFLLFFIFCYSICIILSMFSV